MNMIKHSPYHHKFVALGATFVDRLGFSAPLVFTSTEEEHLATRNGVGLFDVYYQVAIAITGQDAQSFVDFAVVVDAANLEIGRSIYTSICSQDGGMIDDLTCFRISSQEYWLCPTPSRVAQVMHALTMIKSNFSVSVTNLGYKNAYLSVQGPLSRSLLSQLTSSDLSSEALPYFSFIESTVAGIPGALLSRTGYSGELGYELFYPVEYAEHLWESVFKAGLNFGVKPCGLGALRTLRLEKKYLLYGLDADEKTTPLEAGLGWTLKNKKTQFVGKEALERQLKEGVKKRSVLLEFEGLKFVPEIGAQIFSNGKGIGVVTSAEKGYSVGSSLALGYVNTINAKHCDELMVAGANGLHGAKIHLRSIYDPDGIRVHA
jgi:aminomethyltransferase